VRHVHFIGIGGYSMSGLALALKAEGLWVTGSDARRSDRTDMVEAAGIPVYLGHHADHLGDADTVVYSTDVGPDNVERVAALARGLHVVHRSEILAWLMKNRRPVLVTGTHGKTTTTTMTGLVLRQAGVDPMILVGGEVRDLGGFNVVLGQGPWLVAEADESDGSFLRYHPEVAVVTNLEPEHLEHYGGSFANVVEAVHTFVARVPPHGLAVLGHEDPTLGELRTRLDVPVTTFGFEEGADWQAREVDARADGTRFTVWHGGHAVGHIALPVPGRHNVGNALAATAVAAHLGVSVDQVARALAGFQGAKRRFQVLADVRGILVVDDYAHHPTEIRATLRAARQVTRGRVLAAFQPQRYSRTARLWEGFVEVLGDADMMWVADIYAPPGEAPVPGVSSARLAEEAGRRHPAVPIAYAGSVEAVFRAMASAVQPGDLALTMGAGDIWRAARALAAELQGRPATV
jgi:UDP-N-acetylmuramate--alanine ligase